MSFHLNTFMKEKKIKVKATAHAFNNLVERAGIGSVDSAIDELRKSLSYGNLMDNGHMAYLNFPIIGAQMPLAKEDDHYVAKTFYRAFGTNKGEEVKIEYIF